MKRRVLIFLIFLFQFPVSAQTYFNKAYHLNSSDSLDRTEWFTPLLEIPNQGYITAGRSWNGNSGNTKIFILKINYSGDTILTRSYGDSGEYFTPQVMEFTQDSNIIMISSESSYLTDSTWFHLMKLNINGDSLWTRTYTSGLKKTSSRKVSVTTDGGFAMIGWTGNSQNQPGQIYVIKTDSLGNKQWDYQYGDTTKFNNGTSIIQLDDGGFFAMAWTTLGNTLDRDILLIRTDSMGNELWQKLYGTIGILENGERIKKLADHNFIIAGVKCLGPATNSNGKAYLIKIDSAGTIIWEKYYGSYAGQDLFEVYELPDSSLITGSFAWISQIPSLNAGMLLKTNYYGDSLWMKTYLYDTTLTSAYDYAWSFIPTSDNGFLLSGQTGPPPTSTQEGWLVKIDSVGCSYDGCIPVGIPQVHSSITKEKILLFPNPVKSFSNIKLPKALFNQICELTIIDILGKIIYSDSFLPDHNDFTFPLRIGNLASGIYLVKVKSSAGEFSAKLLKQ